MGIEQRNAHRDLGKVRSAEEAEGWLLKIVNLVTARFRVRDDSLYLFEIAVDEINALPADGQPRPAVDPRAPTVKVRDYRPACVAEAFCTRCIRGAASARRRPGLSLTSSASLRTLSIEKGAASE